MTTKNTRKKIAMLRSNPKDATFGKIPLHLCREFDVDCYVWDRQGDYKPVEEKPGITYQKCGIRGDFHAASTFLKLLGFQMWLFVKLLSSRYDCIHAIDLDTGVIGIMVSRLRRKPLVYHCIDPYYVALPPKWPKSFGTLAKKLENCVITHADLFIITDLLRIRQHEGAHPKHMVEFANVPPLTVAPCHKLDESVFIVGYIGSLIEGRNLRCIIEAVGELDDKSVKLVMGGFGPLEDEIRSLCSRFSNVEFRGWTPYFQVLELEQTFDVMLHITDRADPGQRWVSPNKLFECMAFAKPIIAGEGTLVAQRIAATGNGVIVPYGSKQAVKDALLKLKADPDACRRMGEAGRREFEKNWTPQIMAGRLLAALRDILKSEES